MYEVSHFRGTEGLKLLRPKWERLYQSCHNPSFYNHWSWHFSFASHLLPQDISYFLISENTVPVAIFPLQLAEIKKGGMSWKGYRLPQHGHLSLADILLHAQYEGQGLLDFFIRYLHDYDGPKWHILSFTKYPARSNLYYLISQSHYRAQVYSKSYHLYCGSEHTENTLSRKHLKNVNRLERKAKETYGDISMVRVTEPEALEEAYREFLRLEASGWKGAMGKNTCIHSNPHYDAFYQSLINEFSASGNISINLLQANGKNIAGQFCIRSGDSWHLLKIGYDESYQPVGPGNILLKQFIDTLNKEEQTCEVNLVTGPKWAERWRFNEESIYCNEIYNKTLRAQLLMTITGWHKVWKKYRNKNTGAN